MLTKQKIDYDKAYSECIEYFNGDDLAAKVFLDKYALRNGEDLLESTPDDMHRRIARELSRIEKDKFNKPLSENKIYSYLKDFRYIIPQGSPMYGIGNDLVIQSLGNCFVVDSPKDSYGGILYTDQQLAQLMKRRAGVGVCLDNIRPKGQPTKNAAKTTDGISVFMERFSNTTREVAQHGRRGALLQSLSIHHPEIETFITIKQDLTKVTGANISVTITDEFMKAVKDNTEYEQRWPVNSDKPSIVCRVKAKEIWDKIIHSNWKSAEPGILFIDRAKEFGLSDMYGSVDSRFYDITTNPCGEIWMGTDSCRLLLINLLSFVTEPYTKKAKFDFVKFDEVCSVGQRMMDNIVDLEIEKIDKIIKKVKSDPEDQYIKANELKMWQNYKEVATLGRRTGLGITALGDALAAMGVTYGSKKSIKTTEDIYKALAISSMTSSCKMAKELGAFPLYDKQVEKDNEFLRRLFSQSPELKSLHNKHGRRNISLTTTAPAGSVSILTQTTSGIEPVFLLSYMRRRKIRDNRKADFVDALGDKWEEFEVFHHGVHRWSEATGKANVEESPYWDSTSNKIDWKASVSMQAVAQKWITHSISKTCNVPKNVDVKLISEIYAKAYNEGGKGFTVYRDGCRDGVLVEKQKQEIEQTERPRELPCDVHHTTVAGERYFVLVGKKDDRPYEVFAGKNGFLKPKVVSGKIIRKRKGFYKAEFDGDDVELAPIVACCDDHEESISRLTSCLLRVGSPVLLVVQQLEKVQGSMHSFAKGLSRTLKKYIPDGTEEKGELCENCGAESLIRSEGCQLCKSCGASKCV